MSEQQSLSANDASAGGNERLNATLAKGHVLRRFVNTLMILPGWFAPHSRLRVLFHRLRGVQIGRNVEIGYFVFIDHVHPSLVVIEDDAVVTKGVTILAHDNSHFYTHGMDVAVSQVTIGRGSFVGMNAFVSPGVVVGEKAIIGAGSVVTKDVPAGAVAVGNPARVIKTLS